jgi:SAM-dependent methyltransferase
MVESADFMPDPVGQRPWAAFHRAVSHHAPCVSRLTDAMGPCAGKRVLDIGCGAGRNIVPLVAESMQVTGIDIDEQALAEARRRDGCHGAEFHTMSMTHLEFPSETFDGVLAVSVLNHGRTADVDAAFNEVRRVLVARGWFLVTMISTAHPTYGRGEPLEPDVFAPWDGPDAGMPHRFFTFDAFGEYLVARGFQVVDFKPAGRKEIRGINDGHILALARVSDPPAIQRA